VQDCALLVVGDKLVSRIATILAYLYVVDVSHWFSDSYKIYDNKIKSSEEMG